ncbi:porin [Litorimonas sp. RW-G-Af-16]|uniref:porin n=1 Tax=Litorimonas sp. RW-G-Af-16 TaxID=3241168 RepID=UPI003AAB38A7
MSALSRLSTYVGPVLVLSIGAVTMASAQSASPFATKKKKQAWETAPAQQPAPAYAPAQTYTAPSYTPPADYTPPVYAPPATPNYVSQPAESSGAYFPGRPNGGQYKVQSDFAGAAQAQAVPPQPQPQSQSPFSSSKKAWETAPAPQSAPQGTPYQPNPYGAPNYTQPYQSAPQTYQQPAPRRGWKDKLGLDRLATLFQGKGRVGVAALDKDGWSEAFVADADVMAEVSAVTDGGLEYGINLGARAQYDKNRRGFATRLPDCPPTEFGCASVLVAGVPTALRGHTTQFYSFGPDEAKETQVAIESAHLFLRSAYGDVTIGRDDGAAYLFSLGAPTLLAVGASNSPVDYTGLDSVKTVNDASGFSEKLTYTSPRLLGDTVGVGVQFGASYAPNARACGVDYCVRSNDRNPSVINPEIEDIMEVGLSLDRTFDSGLKVEATGTYARGSEQSGLAGLDDLSAYNAGVEVSLADWTLGGSWLKSNNGLLDGDYEAWDTGLTWKPSALGFTLGFGQATDASVNLKSNQAVFGVTYDFDKFTVGTGVQHIQRKSTALNAGIVEIEKQEATALFIEGGFKF